VHGSDMGVICKSLAGGKVLGQLAGVQKRESYSILAEPQYRASHSILH